MLLCAGVMPMQAAGQIVPEDYRFQVGDTVVINRAQTTYMSGETISEWVYYVLHVVQQVGSRRYPDGVRLAGINSWVNAETGLLLLGAVDKSGTALDKEGHDRSQIVERMVELNSMDEQVKESLQASAQQHNMVVMFDAAREQALRDSMAAAEREHALQMQALRDTLDNVKREQQLREQALRDSSLLAEQALRDSLLAEKALNESLSAGKETHDSSVVTRKTEFNRLGAGLRVGVASIMQKTIPEANGKWKAGFDLLADVQYAHYWQPKESSLAYGVLTGLSLGYTRNAVTAQGNRVFDVTDEDGEQLHYTITDADAKEYDGTVMMEIPALFSMIIQDHYFVNAGLRLSVPLYSHYTQDVSKAHIDAYNVTRDVHVTDRLITGKMNDEMLKQSGAAKLSRLNIQLSVEGGYTFDLPNGHMVGVGAYANVGVFSLYPNNPTGKSLIDIDAPTSTAPAAVRVLPVTEAFVNRNGLGFFDCGVKAVYYFMNR